MINKKYGIYGELINEDTIHDLELLDSNLISITKLNEKFPSYNLDEELTIHVTELLRDKLKLITSKSKKLAFINDFITSTFNQPRLINKLLLNINSKSQKYNDLVENFDFSPTTLHTLQNPADVLTLLERNAWTCSTILMVFPRLSLEKLRPLFSFFAALEKKNIKVRIITSKPKFTPTQQDYEALLKLQKYSNVIIKAQNKMYQANEIVHRCFIFVRPNNNNSFLIDFPQHLITSSLLSDSQIVFSGRKKDNLSNYNHIYQDFMLRWYNTDYDLISPKLVKNILINSPETENNIASPEWDASCIKQGFSYPLFPFQKNILQKMLQEKEKNKHLLVFMGDNCGKTIISAHFYKKMIEKNSNKKPKMLFISNRVPKLIKALNQFRTVLKDPKFARLFAKQQLQIRNLNYIFASRQHIKQNLTKFKPNDFDYIFVEGITTANADRYLQILTRFKPQHFIVINKNKNLVNHTKLMTLFNNQYINEINIIKPIKQGLLKKIDYYAIGDNTTDLIGLDVNTSKDIEFSYRLIETKRLDFFTQKLNEYLNVGKTTKALVITFNDAHAKKLKDHLKKFYQKDAQVDVFLSNSKEHTFDDFENRLQTDKLQFLIVTHDSLEFVNSNSFNILINHTFDRNKYDFSRKIFACAARQKNNDSFLILDFVIAVNPDYDYIKDKYGHLFSHYDAEKIINSFTYSNKGLFMCFDDDAKQIIFKRSKNPNTINFAKLKVPDKIIDQQKTYNNFFMDNHYYLTDIYLNNKYLFESKKHKFNKKIPAHLSANQILPSFFNANSRSFLTLCQKLFTAGPASFNDKFLMCALAAFFNNNNCKPLYDEIIKRANEPAGALLYLQETYPLLFQELARYITFRLEYDDNLLELNKDIIKNFDYEKGCNYNIRQHLAIFADLKFVQLTTRIIEELHPRSLKNKNAWIIWANATPDSKIQLLNNNTLLWKSPYNWTKTSISFKEFINPKREVIILYRDRANHNINVSENYRYLGKKENIGNIKGNKPLSLIIKFK